MQKWPVGRDTAEPGIPRLPVGSSLVDYLGFPQDNSKSNLNSSLETLLLLGGGILGSGCELP